ncbi:MAG: hypothetical protein J6M59_11385 [Bacteroidaceae bacterium]|nr:hypothetical protein [Bacteroidaceae bacterium]
MYLPKNLGDSDEWLTPEIKYTIMRMPEVAGLDKLLKDDEKKQYKALVKKRKQNLIQWIQDVNKVSIENAKYELVNSELLSVLILLSVIRSIESEFESQRVDMGSIKLHPENFYFKSDKIPQTWSGLISMIESDKLKIEYLPNLDLNCDAYKYPKILNGKIIH